MHVWALFKKSVGGDTIKVVDVTEDGAGHITLPQKTDAPGTNLLPVMVSGTGVDPRSTELGAIASTVGTEFKTENGKAPRVPPPGGGLLTAMSQVCAEERNEAGTVTFSVVALR